MKNVKYGLQDFKKDFPTEEACLELIFSTLHSHKCSCGGTYKLISGRKQYQCSKCRFQIAPTAGTIFHKSPTPLSLWFHSIWVFSNAKSGISAKQLERQLGVTYKCAWRILSLIRKALKQSNDQLSGVVETDVGYLGGQKNAGKNNINLSEAMKAKSVVLVAVQRGGKIKAQVSESATADEIEDFLKNNVTVGSILMTDTAKAYRRMDKGFDRFPVNHSKGEYVRGAFNVNTVETFFSHIKRSIRGTFKSVSKEYLQTYLDAFVFHYNNRYSDKGRFGVLMGTLLHA